MLAAWKKTKGMYVYILPAHKIHSHKQHFWADWHRPRLNTNDNTKYEIHDQLFHSYTYTQSQRQAYTKLMLTRKTALFSESLANDKRRNIEGVREKISSVYFTIKKRVKKILDHGTIHAKQCVCACENGMNSILVEQSRDKRQNKLRWCIKWKEMRGETLPCNTSSS